MKTAKNVKLKQNYCLRLAMKYGDILRENCIRFLFPEINN